MSLWRKVLKLLTRYLRAVLEVEVIKEVSLNRVKLCQSGTIMIAFKLIAWAW